MLDTPVVTHLQTFQADICMRHRVVVRRGPPHDHSIASHRPRGHGVATGSEGIHHSKVAACLCSWRCCIFAGHVQIKSVRLLVSCDVPAATMCTQDGYLAVPTQQRFHCFGSSTKLRLHFLVHTYVARLHFCKAVLELLCSYHCTSQYRLFLVS